MAVERVQGAAEPSVVEQRGDGWRRGERMDTGAVQQSAGRRTAKEQNGAEDVRALDEKTLVESLEKLQKMASAFNRHLRFELKRDPDLLQVSVIDSESDEVVRKIPPDEVVRMIEQIDRMVGVLFDRKI